MGKLRWYKRDPDAALAGMAELTLVERGAYNSIIDLLYSRDGNVPDDDILVARMIGCHWREWKAVKARLVERGKVHLEGGKITANRVQETLKEAADFSQDQSRRASRRWHKVKNINKNNEPSIPPGNANTTTTTSTIESAYADSSARKEPDDDFIEWYAAYPRHVGKGAAARAYRSARKKVDAATLLVGAERAAAQAGDPQFIPHPATWLNGERWLDDDEPHRAHGGGNGARPKGVIAALRLLENTRADRERGSG